MREKRHTDEEMSIAAQVDRVLGYDGGRLPITMRNGAPSPGPGRKLVAGFQWFECLDFLADPGALNSCMHTFPENKYGFTMV